MIRPVKPIDALEIKELFYSLSEKSVYERFMSYEKVMPPQLRNLMALDYERRMAFIAMVREKERYVAVGVSSYETDLRTGYAEVSLQVLDEYQSKGLGGALFEILMSYAKGLKLKGFTAEVLPTNSRMLNIFLRSGLNTHTHLEEDIIAVRMDF